MSLPNSNSSKYRADIDGLRAIAVLAVLFFHAEIGFGGGYVGVDVFFVISGYLITGLILKDIDAGQFQILEFWERRVRRILPALAVVVFSSLTAGWFLFLPLDFKGLGQSAVAQALLVSNVYFWRESGYFAQAAEVKPLLHTWSLAVEEQFYVFFPFLLVAIKRFSRKCLVPAILLLSGISFCISVYCSYRHPSVNFYLLPTRAWELLFGSFLAALPPQRASVRWLTESLSWSGLLAILYAVFFYDRETRFPGAAAILPCVGAALVIWANGHTLTFVGKLLAARPVVFVGLISYSLYLWHWPVLVFPKYWTLGPIPQSQRILLILASIGLAVLTWRFVETPFRKRMILKSRGEVFWFAGITTSMLLLTGLAITKSQGMPSRMPVEVLRYIAGETDRAFLNDVSLKDAQNGAFIELGTGSKHLPVDILVWGDSHAMAVMPALDILCKEHFVRGVAATHSQTAPLVDFESQGKYALNGGFNNAVIEFISSNRVGDVLLVAMWGNYGTDDVTARVLRRSLLSTISALKTTGAKIWIMKQVPHHPWNVPRTLASAVFRGKSPEWIGSPMSFNDSQFAREDLIFEDLAAMHPDVTVLNPTVYFADDSGRCRVAEGGKALYCDEHHLSVAGAMILRPLFEPIFGRIGKSPTPNNGKAVTE